MTFLSTRQVARLLGIEIHKLTNALWTGKVVPPPKSPSGSFLWTAHDTQRASWALRHRSADFELGESGAFEPEVKHE